MFRRIKNTTSNITSVILTKENAPNIASGIIFTSAGLGLHLLTPYLLGEAVEALTTESTASIFGIECSPLTIVGLYGTAWTISGLIATWSNQLLTPIGPKSTKKLVVRYVDNLMNQSLGHHLTTPLGDHINRIYKCYTAIPHVSTQVFGELLPTSLEMGIALGLLSHWYGAEVGCSLGGALVVYFIYSAATAKKIKRLREEMLMQGILSSNHLTETLSHYETVHAFNNLPHTMEQLETILSDYATAENNALTVIPKIGTGQVIISGAALTGISLLVSNGILANKFNIRDFVTISSYLAQFSGPLAAFGLAANQLIAAITELEIVFNELLRTPAIVDRHPDKELQIDYNNATIEFDNVSFHYHEDTPVLKNVSFVAKAGKKTGIVGTSGSGKSTIGNLIFRFYEPTSGRVLINGQDTREVSLNSLRSAISIVAQSPVLFNDTIYNNIAYGARSFGVEKEKVTQAAHAACLDDYIAKQPDGIETIVGERGAKLSGGQRQRLAIARAFVKDPSIYIFDEATSALDNQVEREIQDNIDTISKGVTSIVITHRLATLVNADKIIVLDRGKIVEQGTHEQLLAIPHGKYKALWKEQNKSVVIDMPMDSEDSSNQDAMTISIKINEKKTNSPSMLNFFSRKKHAQGVKPGQLEIKLENSAYYKTQLSTFNLDS